MIARLSLLCLGVACAMTVLLWTLGRSPFQPDHSVDSVVAGDSVAPPEDRGSDTLLPSTTIDAAPVDQVGSRLAISTDAPATLTVTVMTKGLCVHGATVKVEATSTSVHGDIKRFLAHAARSSDSGESAETTTDESGEAVLNLRGGVEYLVHVSVDAEGRSARVPNVPGLSPGEHRRLTVELPPAEEGHYFILVLARETRKPIVRARASILAHPTSRAPNELRPTQGPGSQAAPSAVSDDTGMIDLRVPLRESSKVTVVADGFAPAFVIANGKSAPDRAQVVFLDRSGTLEVTVIDQNGAPVAGAFGEFSVESTSLFQPIETSTVFGRQFGRCAWAFETDAAGKHSVQGLPPGVSLEARLARTQLGVRQVVDKLMIESGELRSVTLILPGE